MPSTTATEDNESIPEALGETFKRPQTTSWYAEILKIDGENIRSRITYRSSSDGSSYRGDSTRNPKMPRVRSVRDVDVAVAKNDEDVDVVGVAMKLQK
ncbi:unnamed protein product [Vicia faba]|uniref:Uncharacterized protein n=1 Tax=Vicia faba TaxID=3906 RepID=A0AAV1AG46_VICFA|nr:unnamed protein product [Vicia faba]